MNFKIPESPVKLILFGLGAIATLDSVFYFLTDTSFFTYDAEDGVYEFLSGLTLLYFSQRK